MVLSFYWNFNAFITGSTPKAVSFCSSILFVANCFCLSFIKKSRKAAMIPIMYTGFITIISLAALVEMECGLLTEYLIIFVLIAMPPFYGLNIFHTSYTFSLIVFLLIILLFIVNVCFFIKKRHPTNNFTVENSFFQWLSAWIAAAPRLHPIQNRAQPQTPPPSRKHKEICRNFRKQEPPTLNAIVFLSQSGRGVKGKMNGSARLWYTAIKAA